MRILEMQWVKRKKKIEEIGSWDSVSKRIIDFYKNKLQKK